jgi:hypothetical protein
MKPADKKRLKLFWLGKVCFLTSFIGAVGIVVVEVPFLQSLHASVQEAEVPKAINAHPDSLLKDLESPEFMIAPSAALDLGQLGDKRAVPFLLKRLNDSDSDVRDSAALALGQLGDKRAVPFLLKRLNDSDFVVQNSAALALGQLGDKRAVPFLLKRLNDGSPYDQELAAWALGQLGDKRAVPFLLKRLSDSDSAVRNSAALALGQLGDKRAVPSILERLNDIDSDVRNSAALALGQLGDKRAVPFLLTVLREKRPTYRSEIFSTLKKLNESGQLANFSQSTAYLFLALGGGLFLGTVFVGGMGLVFFLRVRNPYPLNWSGHLVLPEEAIAELIALKRRRQKQNIPKWKIYCELIFFEILPLLLAQHIQVRLQNLSLPPSKKRNID